MGSEADYFYADPIPSFRFWSSHKNKYDGVSFAQNRNRLLVRRWCTGHSFFSWLFMAGDIRDGTGRDCFDMFGGKKNENGTGRDGKIMKIIVSWTVRDGTGRFV